MNGKALQMNCRDMPLACFKCYQLIYASPNMPKAKALKKSSFLKTKTKNAYDL